MLLIGFNQAKGMLVRMHYKGLLSAVGHDNVVWNSGLTNLKVSIWTTTSDSLCVLLAGSPGRTNNQRSELVTGRPMNVYEDCIRFC